MPHLPHLPQCALYLTHQSVHLGAGLYLLQPAKWGPWDQTNLQPMGQVRSKADGMNKNLERALSGALVQGGAIAPHHRT